ncbi:MAG: hypothetical protein OYG32_04915 [Rhodospirillaceae bacterium]|nr:hypothetical protein [Rhodospirillaceae bacterium]
MPGRRRPAPRKWTAGEIRRLCDLWSRGESVKAIASRLHRSRKSVRAAARRHRLGERGGPRAVACMTCARLFSPEHRFNRICPDCKSGDDWRSGGDWSVEW